MSKYTLRESAIEDLKEIGRYTKKQWSVEQRDKYLQRFSKRFSWLAENPLFGRPRDEVKHGYFSYNEGSHVIFYIVANNSIEILGVLHESMEAKRHL